MARWEPGYFQAEDIAVRRLISAHPEDYQRFLVEAVADLPAEPCESCAYLGAAALQLADLLGHDRQGHQAFRALWSHQILSVAHLLAALDGDLGLYYLHGQGLGAGGLERIHDRVRRLEPDQPGPDGGPPARVPTGAGSSPTAGG
ncbi:hypothetical protein ACFYZ8_34210 [Streptomyces sp. NPDC001668]|uniref:hypothetical protein n=1 Tax=Streptomyces sp. NPDC001668 TaxID=3364598 RepID=UPI0036AF5473